MSLYGDGNKESGENKECGDTKKSSDSWSTGFIFARAQNWARYLSEMPANKMTPVDFAQVFGHF